MRHPPRGFGRGDQLAAREIPEAELLAGLVGGDQHRAVRGDLEVVGVLARAGVEPPGDLPSLDVHLIDGAVAVAGHVHLAGGRGLGRPGGLDDRRAHFVHVGHVAVVHAGVSGVRVGPEIEAPGDLEAHGVHLDEFVVHHVHRVEPVALRVHPRSVRHDTGVNGGHLDHGPGLHHRDGARDVVAVEVEVDDVEQPRARRDVHRRREHAEGGVPEPLVGPRLVLVDGAEGHAVGDGQEPVTPVGRDVDAVRALGLRREAAHGDRVELLEAGGAVAEQVDGVIRLGADVNEVVAPRRLGIFGGRERGEGQAQEQDGRREEAETGAGRHQFGSPMLRGVSGSTSRTAQRPELKSVKKMVPLNGCGPQTKGALGLKPSGSAGSKKLISRPCW